MNAAIGPVSSERELQENLNSYFEAHDWIALREQSPKGSRVKADLIVNNKTYGWFGIETKYFTNDGGSKVADVHHQIVPKYRSKKYFTHRINLWVVCPYFSGADVEGDEWQTQRANWRHSYTREFFCRHSCARQSPTTTY
ncbi:MAG: hypothetical protein J07HQX50_01791 [Haloquadratum sp. J07HQX50]|nr:MAG: hypothetical protein J07HQX50_01791 [Haloquadratum sp. J07HQX50]